MNKLTERSETLPVAGEDKMLSLIERVVLSPDADISKLEKMLELQQKWEKNNAKKIFFKAFAQFQKEMPPVVSAKEGYGYDYAPLCDITRTAVPYLSENGLSYRFEHALDGDKVSVTCVITHVDGHSESTQSTASMIESPRNSKGGTSMNSLQQIGATVTYLRRYTLTSILGITTADKDSDGRLDNQEGDLISDTQLAELEELIKPFSAQRDKFLDACKVKELRDLPLARFSAAKAKLIKKAQGQ